MKFLPIDLNMLNCISTCLANNLYTIIVHPLLHFSPTPSLNLYEMLVILDIAFFLPLSSTKESALNHED
jgi:hypothetical protein